MRVLVVHNRYRSGTPSGEDRVVDQEADALVAAGHDVGRFERRSDSIASLPLHRKALVPAQVVWSNETRRSLIERLRSFGPDVVHVHNTFPLMSPSVLYACRAEKVPVVVTAHNYSLVCASGDLFRDGGVCHRCVGNPPLPAIRHRCYRQSALATAPLATGLVAHRRAWRRLVSAYIFLSHAQRKIVASDGFPTDRVFVKPNFVPRVPIQAADPDDLIVYAGRLSEQKGAHLLMDAWDRYCDGGAGHLRLVVAGTGPLERHVASWAEGRPSVEWVGMLSRSGCESLMARARAVIVPSAWEEPFGLVVAETMAAGVPPVAPAHGSFPELITDGSDGVLFEPGSPSALAAVLQDIEARPTRYRALGRAAHVTYERRFTPEVNLEMLSRVYEFAVTHPVV